MGGGWGMPFGVLLTILSSLGFTWDVWETIKRLEAGVFHHVMSVLKIYYY